MAHKSDAELIDHVHNTSRFFVENQQIAWACVLAVLAWGVYGYLAMPQRKDPDIPVRAAVASCLWPGADAQQVEQLLTRPIEQAIAQNKTIHAPGPDSWGIRSLSLPGASYVYVQLSDTTTDSREQFSDINLKLQALNGRLPSGASPIQFQSEFGDTATVMLTIASPPVDDLELRLRAQAIAERIRSARTAEDHSPLPAVSVVLSFPLTVSQAAILQVVDDFRRSAEQDHVLDRPHPISGQGFIGVDGGTTADDARLTMFLNTYATTRLQPAEINPDVWRPVIIRDVNETQARLSAAAGAKYSYAQLDDFTDLIGRTLLGVPQTSRFERRGILPQAIYLDYSQERLAAYGLRPADLGKILNARNVTLPGGLLEAGTRSVRLNPSGEFADAGSIGDVVVATSAGGAPVYLRDLVRISRGYRAPADYLNYYTWADSASQWHRSRAITVAVYMRSGEQIQRFGAAVDEQLRDLRRLLPSDLIVARTSDQPLQVHESVGLFMEALYEAIALVVLIALVGFWEWRSALLMALSIPITLAMTFGLIQSAGVDLQQVSIATLIIALGLLVDDPVVANDAIKRELAGGLSRVKAAWIGPTRLARAIVYATATNIIAYLPFLLLTGSTGDFLRSLPIVMTAALVSSRIVSMTFIPLLGFYLLKPRARGNRTIEERRQRGFYGWYYGLSGHAVRHRWTVLALSIIFLAVGGVAATRLRTQFFPDDVQYWLYVDVWLPNNAPVSLTNETARQAEAIVQRVVANYEQLRSGSAARDRVSTAAHASAPTPLLRSATTFIGGGGPRFWFSASPEQQQPNYAQVLVQVTDKEATPDLVQPLQAALSEALPGAYAIVHQLQTNPIEFPIEVRISSTSDIDPKSEAADNATLRRLAGQVQDLLSPVPGVQLVQNDWLPESFDLGLEIDADRANLSGITNRDVAESTQAISGNVVTALREGNLQIPVIARLRMQERAQLADIENLYVYASSGQEKVPLQTVSSVRAELTTQRIRREEHFRTIGVHAWPQPGVLSSEILTQARPKLLDFERRLPSGYRMAIGGEQAKQRAGFANLTKVLLISLVGIYAALLIQFRNAIKPLLVLAATPYGVVGALVALALMGTPFGFMAFLGIASLIGVIISHVIVLFDFVEEMHEKGEPFIQAIRDAGIERLRPVLITVGATIFALFPLASHGGPLWQPLCYAQIGGLAVATFITLLLVPVLYSIAVLDVKIVRWDVVERRDAAVPNEREDTSV